MHKDLHRSRAFSTTRDGGGEYLEMDFGRFLTLALFSFYYHPVLSEYIGHVSTTLPLCKELLEPVGFT